VKKFKDRAAGVSRIWRAIQSLGEAPAAIEPKPVAGVVAPAAELPEADPVSEDPTSETGLLDAVSEASDDPVGTPVAPQTPDVAPETAPAKKGASRAKKAPAANKPAADATAPRDGSKSSQVIAMLKGEGGTTLEEIMAKMGWQKHTTRALLSAGGSLTKKHGLVVTSEKVGETRIYSIKA